MDSSKRLVGFLVPTMLVTGAGAAYAKPLKLPIYIATVEVSLDGKLAAPTIAEKIGKEMLIERDYYEATGRAAIMRVTVDKLKLKSSGKALLTSIPIMGMFAGTDENMVRANIRLVDQLSGEPLGAYDKIQVDDSRGFSAGDLAGEVGSTALSFIPVPFLGEALTTAGDMAASAGSRDVAELKMARNLARTAFCEIYGKAAAKIATGKRKAAQAAQQLASHNALSLAPASTPVPAAPADAEKSASTEPVNDTTTAPKAIPQPLVNPQPPVSPQPPI